MAWLLEAFKMYNVFFLWGWRIDWDFFILKPLKILQKHFIRRMECTYMCLAQGHLHTEIGRAGDRTSDLPVSSQPTVPPHPHASPFIALMLVKVILSVSTR